MSPSGMLKTVTTPFNKQVVQQVMASLSCQGCSVHCDRLAQSTCVSPSHPSCVGHLLAYFILGHRLRVLVKCAMHVFCHLYMDVKRKADFCLISQTGLHIPKRLCNLAVMLVHILRSHSPKEENTSVPFAAESLVPMASRVCWPCLSALLVST